MTDPQDVSRVLGGEACLWGETAGASDFSVKIWPRAAAVAEALVSGPEDDKDAALARLLRHRCRLVQRGIAVAELQTGFC